MPVTLQTIVIVLLRTSPPRKLLLCSHFPLRSVLAKNFFLLKLIINQNQSQSRAKFASFDCDLLEFLPSRKYWVLPRSTFHMEMFRSRSQIDLTSHGFGDVRRWRHNAPDTAKLPNFPKISEIFRFFGTKPQRKVPIFHLASLKAIKTLWRNPRRDAALTAPLNPLGTVLQNSLDSPAHN